MSDIGDLDYRIMELVSFLPDKEKYQLLSMLEDWRQGQNRYEHREPCLIPVDILNRDRVYRDFIYNLSESGAFIETQAPFYKGQPVSLTFSESDEQRHYKINGVVIRSNSKGVAIKFNQKIQRDKDATPKKQSNPFIQLVKNTITEN